MSHPPPLAPRELIIRNTEDDGVARIAMGVEIRSLVSAECGALGFSTGLASFKPGAFLPVHRHPVGEAITVLEGEALLQVETRRYRMAALDCVFIPAGTPHGMRNPERGRDLKLHSAFASAQVSRELVIKEYRIEERGWDSPASKDPEKIVRFARASTYELAENATFTDLFSGQTGAVGICGGYGRFLPSASLPCHLHEFDESITIVKGSARCQVQGRHYDLSDFATAYVPEQLPHRFLNYSDQEMAMVWVYAAPEPGRRILDAGYCSGTLAWPGPYLVR